MGPIAALLATIFLSIIVRVLVYTYPVLRVLFYIPFIFLGFYPILIVLVVSLGSYSVSLSYL